MSSPHTTDNPSLAALVAKLAAYVHASEDIPSWDEDEITSQLEDILRSAPSPIGDEEDPEEEPELVLTDDEIRTRAIQAWGDELEFDEDAEISRPVDCTGTVLHGVYVQAWVWVSTSPDGD